MALTLEIGALKLAIKGLSGRSLLKLQPVYKSFISAGRPDTVLTFKKVRALSVDFPRVNRFRSGILDLYQLHPNYYSFTFQNSNGYGTIDQNRHHFTYYYTDLLSVSINPLVEMVYTFLIDQMKDGGLILHACGTVNNGQGYIFAAESGGGKSTIGKIALNSGKVLLNDDRIIVREVKNWLMAFGNPWHGDVSWVDPVGARLTKIFFLRKGKRNSLRKVSPTSSAIKLLSNAFYFPINFAARKNIFNRCADLAMKIPAYELTFYPDERIWKDIERG